MISILAQQYVAMLYNMCEVCGVKTSTNRESLGAGKTLNLVDEGSNPSALTYLREYKTNEV